MSHFRNKNTHFGTFKWGDKPDLRRKLEGIRERFWPPTPPVRLKIKLGVQTLKESEAK